MTSSDEEEDKRNAEKKKKPKKAQQRELSFVDRTYEQLGWGRYIHEVCLSVRFMSCNNYAPHCMHIYTYNANIAFNILQNARMLTG